MDTWHGTTILTLRKKGRVVVAGDGQVSLGSTVIKANARKVRQLAEEQKVAVGMSILAGREEVDPERIGGGRGTRSMLSRAGELHGDISWQAGTQGGTKVLLRFPLPAAPPAAAGSPPRDGQGSMPR